MRLYALGCAVFALGGCFTVVAMPYDQTRCLDVKLGGNVSYRTCRHYEDPRTEIYKEEVKLNRAISKTRLNIENQIKHTWQPPMGYSGYLINVYYGIDEKGYITYINIDNSNVSDEIIEGLKNTFKKFEPYSISSEIAEHFKNNRMQIRIN